MEGPRLLAAFSFAAIAFAFPTAAQWTPVPAATPPPGRFGAVLVPWQNGELLLFGGDAANPAVTTEWSWNGIRWAPVTTPVPRRDFSAIARNEGDGSLLLCGGLSSIGTTLNDTWRFAAGTWTQQFPTTVPTGHPVFMAHEPGTEDMILLTQSLVLTYDTWRFTGGDWTPVNTSQPFAAPVVALFADTVRSEVCMLTSGAAGLTVRRLVGLAWQDVAQIPSTSAPTWAALDSDRGRAVIVQVQPNGTWTTFEYDGARLVAQSAVTVPSTVGLGRGALAYHAERHEAVLAGGFTSVETWRWNVGAVPMATAYGAPCVLPSFELGLAPGDSPEPGGVHRLLATGGNAAALTLSVLGFSHVQTGGLPLPLAIPIGPLGCQLRVEALALNVLGVGTPVQQVVAVPNAASLLGARYDAQSVQFDATGVTDATNGLEVQIGRPLPANVLLETFATDANRDPIASGDVWGNGSAVPVAIGGDGRHGSFDPALGSNPSPGVFVWNTGAFTIPAANTLTGISYSVTDGRFFFTDFVVPAGVTVRFTGPVPAQIFVRGTVLVQGTVDISGNGHPTYVSNTPPATGQLVSTFNAKLGAPTPVGPLLAGQAAGQPGSSGQCGGGDGGRGGCEAGLANGAVPSGGINVADGQPGEGVFVAAGHAYGAFAAAAGGRGSQCFPANGVSPSTTTPPAPHIIGANSTYQYRPQFSPGGSGGGFSLAGLLPPVPTIPGMPTQPSPGPAPLASSAFPLFPLPAPGFSSLNHFVVGGSGGGGGGSHPYASRTTLVADIWSAGHGGTGGGGGMAIRAGGDVTVAGGGQLLAKGGAGVRITGDDPNAPVVPLPAQPDVLRGVSSPGGGGSGGSFLVQSGRNVGIAGVIDTRGGAGCFTEFVQIGTNPFVEAPAGQLAVIARGGDGSVGFYRVEAASTVTFNGTGVPTWNPAVNSGALTDQDALSGSRSLWLLPPAGALPYWLRYELVVDIGGQTVVFSDDPAVSAIAASAPGPVHLRFQGAQLDPVTGLVVPGTVGPWRSQLMPGSGSLNRDRAQVLRFDLVLDKTTGPIAVRELRLVWR